MPEWRRLIRQRLGDLGIPPADEMGIVEELAQHLDDRYRELCSAGRTDAEALETSLGELGGDGLADDFRDSLTGKDENVE